MSPAIDLPYVHSGKVRDIFDAGDDRLLMVTSDRISAFDVVMDEPIPHKGRVLTAMSAFWFDLLADVVPGHLLSTDPADAPGTNGATDLAGRTMLCRRAEMLPIECIVRGYLAGSKVKEYQSTGAIQGVVLPAGIEIGSKLPEPIFTPTTKEASGHDQPVTYAEMCAEVGEELGAKLKELSLKAFRIAAA